MSLIADGLQPFLIQGLLSLGNEATPIEFAEGVFGSPKTGFDLDFDSTSQTIKIDLRDQDQVLWLFANDACRFARASFASMQVCELEIENKSALPWGLIKSYYSSFYAGHGIIRLLGQTCNFIEPRHATRIKNLAKAQGVDPGFNIDAGLYHCVINGSQTGFSMKMARGRVGGAHEAFWQVFGDLLSSIPEAVLLGYLAPSEATSVFLQLDALNAVLRTSAAASASWLSAVRNVIQYRHGYDVWPPASMRKSGRGTLGRIAGQWLNDPMSIDLQGYNGSDLGRFLLACSFIAAVCRTMFVRISERSSLGTRSFAKGPLRLCSGG